MLLSASLFVTRVGLILLALSAAAAEDMSNEPSPTADCVPKEPLLASWTSLQVNCTLNRTDLSADQVVCRFGTEIFQTAAVDDRTFQVMRENVTRQMSQGHVFCHANASGKLLKIAQFVMRVADIPTAPRITECVVYNWDRMNCSWGESPDTGLPTNYSLGWTVDPTGYYHCPHQQGRTCEWRTKDTDKRDALRMDMDYHLKIYATNDLLQVASQPQIYHTSDIVKPNPVTGINASSITNVSAELRWTWISSVDRQLIFQISFSSDWDTETNTTEETIYKNITLVDLLPYTNYTVSIACKSYKSEQPRGFWSSKTSYRFRTAGSVPCLAPSVTAGGYHIRNADNKERDIEIFWQPLHQKFLQGNLKHYRIRCFDVNNGHILCDGFENKLLTVPYYYHTKLPLDLDIGVTVEAETDQGRNGSLELDTILIPRAGTVPPKPEIYYSIRYDSEIVVGWSHVSNASGYTVYWCKRGSVKCETTLSWESLPQNVTNLTISIRDFSKFDEFLVGISVEAYDYSLERTVSSGFVETECVHDKTKDVLTPESFRKSKDQQAYNFTIEWEKPNCHKTAFIVSYELLYCERQTCNDKFCCKENQTLNISNSIRKFTITNLQADVEYEAWIRSRSLVGVSPFSPPVHHLVFRSGLTTGAIVAIVIAAIVLLFLMTVGLVAIVKKTKKACWGDISIEYPPPKVSCHIDSKVQGVSISGYNTALDGRNGETKALLEENSIYKNEKPLIANGNAEHKADDELSRPFVNGVLDGGDRCVWEVAPATDSSISPYAHLTVAEESKINQSVDSREMNRLPSFDVDSRILPKIGPALPPSVPRAETKTSDGKLESHTPPYMPVGSVATSGNSSSTIAPYTTVEQIAEPDTIQRGVNLDGDSDINPKRFDSVLGHQNGVTEIGDGKGVLGVQVNACNHNGVVTNSQPAYTNQHELAGDGVFKEYVGGTVLSPSMKPPLPVSYIPLAPTLST